MLFPGAPLQIGDSINPEVFFHSEMLERRNTGVIDRVISQDTIENIHRVELNIPTTEITTIFEGINFATNNIFNNFVPTLPSVQGEISINSSEINTIITQFGTRVRASMIQAVESIQRQDFENLERVRLSMQENLERIRLEESRILPLSLDDNLQISYNNSPAGNDFITSFFRFMGDDFLNYSLNIFVNSNHGSRGILLILILQLLSFGIIKFRYYGILNLMSWNQVLEFIFTHLNTARIRPINVNVGRRILSRLENTINQIQNSLTESLSRTNNMIRSNSRSRFSLQNLVHYILSNPYLQFLTGGGFTILIVTGGYRLITAGSNLANTANSSMNININYAQNNTELSNLLTQTINVITEKFKTVLKELINKIQNK